VVHFEVQEYDVRSHARRQGDGFATRSSFAHHLEVVLVGQYANQPLPHDWMVVHDQDADHAGASRGTRATMRVPLPGALLISSRPPSSLARSRMPMIPWPPP